MGGIISTIQDTISTLTAARKALSDLNTQHNALLVRISSPPGLPIPNPTTSYWLQNPPFPDLTDIQDPLPKETDVLIIGSGITGAAVANTLLELGDLDVVVCEARGICSGATGRNGGHVKSTPYELFANLRGKMGPERARSVVRFQRRHLEVLLEVGGVVPEGEVREVETVDLFLKREDFEKGRREVQEMAEWLEEEECRVWEAEEVRREFGVNERVVGGISYKAGALWPYRLITGVWNRLVKEHTNLTISTHTAVEAITTSPSPTHPYLITTSRGTVAARHVIHATNAHASHLVPSLRPTLTGALATMSAQRPGSSFPDSRGRRSWSPIYLPGFDYVTQRENGDLMVGGGFFRSRGEGMDQVGVWDDGRVDLEVEVHVRGIMGALFGGGGEVLRVWSGILGITGDMMPLVGRLPHNISNPPHDSSKDEDSGQWIAAGFCGEGMVWAWLCGTALAIKVLGKEDEELEKGVGRPGGVLASWFPGEELKVSEGRLKRADLKNLAHEFLS